MTGVTCLIPKQLKNTACVITALAGDKALSKHQARNCRANYYKDVVMSHVFMVLAPNKWNSLWMNRQQLMSRIGKKYPVIYSNGPYFSWERKEAMSESTLRGSFHKQDNVILDTSPLMMMRFPIIPKLDEFIVKGNAKRWSVMMSTLHRKQSGYSMYFILTIGITSNIFRMTSLFITAMTILSPWNQAVTK